MSIAARATSPMPGSGPRSSGNASRSAPVFWSGLASPAVTGEGATRRATGCAAKPSAQEWSEAAGVIVLMTVVARRGPIVLGITVL
ncbi:MAG: hypothetical protein V7646_2152 [Pseudonocardia sp.]